MADDRRLRFSRAGSAAIQKEFEKAISPIAEAFKSAQNTVDGLHEWWDGETADAFVSKFAETKQKVNDELNKWLESNIALMKKIEEIKFSNEAANAQRIRSM
ncbi:MAG: hypothetical protein FWH52_02485 [Synergistaceae bacterium]|nr:hypothetical protein [Synergistaceae bacterium]